MRLRDDADAPAVLPHQGRDDVRGKVGLAGAGRPLHGEVGVVEPEQTGRDGAHAVVRVSQRFQAGAAGRTGGQDVGGRIPWPARVDRDNGVSPLLYSGHDALRFRRRARSDRGWQLVPRILPGGAHLVDPDDTTVKVCRDRHGQVEHAARPATGLAERYGLVVQRERVALRRAASGRPGSGCAQPASQITLLSRAAPVGFDAHALDHEDPASVGPEVHGLGQAREVLPPKTLVLAAVVVDRGGREGVGRGILNFLGGVAAPQQLEVEGARLKRVAVEVPYRGPRGDTKRRRLGEQPVAQPTRGDTVVPVVVGDRIENLLRLDVVAAGPGDHGTLVLFDGCRGVRHPVVGTVLLAHVKGL